MSGKVECIDCVHSFAIRCNGGGVCCGVLFCPVISGVTRGDASCEASGEFSQDKIAAEWEDLSSAIKYAQRKARRGWLVEEGK